MEEHSTTQQQPVAIGGGKRELTKKQKIATGLAAFIALVGIGIGGYFGWQNIISNAEGETDLGTDVVMATSPTPYIKVSQESHQSVCIKLPESEATTRENNYAEGDTVGMGVTWLYALKSDYVIQRESIKEPTKWITIADGADTQSTIRVSDIATDQCVAYDDGFSTINSVQTVTGDALFDPDQKLQYNTTYHYRVAQKQGDTVASVGDVQTIILAGLPALNVKEQKANYATFDLNTPQLGALQWVSGQGLRIVRASSADKLLEGKANLANVEQLREFNLAPLGKPIDTSYTASQPVNSVFYYAVIIPTPNGKFYASAPVAVSTNDKKVDDAITLTVNKKSVPVNELGSLAGNLSLNPAYAYPKQPHLTYYRIWMNVQDGEECTLSDGSSNPTKTDPASAFVTEPADQTQYQLNGVNASNQVNYSVASPLFYCNPYLAHGGTVAITAESVLQGSLQYNSVRDLQTVRQEITLEKISPLMSGKYFTNKISRGSKATVYVSYPFSHAYAAPKGKLILKNRRTGKVLGTSDCAIDCPNESAVFSWKAKKRGTYKLDVVYQADPTQALYTDQTIQLPDLIVR